tara:strand:+ start:24407 stop:24733 length:327 start_codon:yes stop_codon:yes gene_type:complete
MKKQILTSLILASLSASAFALPQTVAQPLQYDTQARSTIAADGSDRTGANRVAEGGADRLNERLRLAEDGADRTGGPNRVAEGGADRLNERLRLAEDGADRTGPRRIG